MQSPNVFNSQKASCNAHPSLAAACSVHKGALVAVALCLSPTTALGTTPRQELSLEQCVERAAEDHPRVRAAKSYRSEQAARTTGGFLGLALPSLTAESGLNGALGQPNTDTNSQRLGIRQATPLGTQIDLGLVTNHAFTDKPGFAVSIQQPLLDGLLNDSRYVDYSIQAVRQQIAETLVDTTKAALRYEVATAFYGFLLARRQLELKRQNLSTLMQLESGVKRMAAEKLIAAAELVPISQAILQSRIALVELEDQLFTTENRLRALINEPPRKSRNDGRPLTIRQDLTPPSKAPILPANDSAALRVANLELEELRRVEKSLWWNQLPGLNVGVSLQGPMQRTMTATNVASQQIYAVEISLAIENLLGPAIHEHSAAAHAVAAQQAQIEELERNLRSNILTLADQKQATADRGLLLAEAVRLAQTKLGNERKLYLAGRSTIFVVLTYIDELTATRFKVVENHVRLLLFEEERRRLILS